jgi:acetoacetyl-CoA synthetase
MPANEDNQLERLPRKLWAPPNPQKTLAYAFMQEINKKYSTNLQTWPDLHSFSVTHRSLFWSELLKQHPIIHSGQYSRVVDENARMDSRPKWFEGLQVNYAENALFWPDARDPSIATTHRKEDHRTACVEVREGATEIRPCTWREIRERSGLVSNAMRARGVGKGDRIAVVASNSIDTLSVFHGATTLGGIFSSSATDMGTKGVLDRLRQVRPKFVFVDDWALYNGRKIDLREKIGEIVKGMQGIDEFEAVISVPRTQNQPLDVSRLAKVETWASFLAAANGDKSLRFERVGFNDPFIIVYSSGTTGMPKCIVHSVGAVLLNGKKEADLHRDTGLRDPDDMCLLQYTTTGWIMYLTACASLVNACRTILYDGSPFQPDLKMFLQLASSQKVTDLGISPRYLSTLAMAKPPVLPRDVVNLSHLRRVISTGMVLSEAQFEWFYDHAFPAHVQLSNISGGTDIAACFAMDNTMMPVYAGGCVYAGLGMKMETYDQEILGGRGVQGRALPSGDPGEMVCTRAFPTQPIEFWGDERGEKYFDAYFARFDNVWTHGDFISIHPQTGGVYLHGRADGVLNPSGVRFGSAEIYNVLDLHFPDEIQDSICVGQRRPQDLDESVMLFLLMKPGKKFTQDLVSRVKTVIAKDCGRRCVPKYVFETPEIPVSLDHHLLPISTLRKHYIYTDVQPSWQTTINLKKVELPVKQIVSGKIIKPSDTLANKDCLKYYYQFAKVEELVQVKSKL